MHRLHPLVPHFSTNATSADAEDDNHIHSKGFPHSLVLPNDASTARDHLANERTFLSWLRMAMTLSIVSLAIIISFHLRIQPSVLEQRMALPLGIIFFVLSLLALGGGTANYAKTTHGYAARKPIVETGTKTTFLFAFIATAIVISCIVFIVTGASGQGAGSKSSSKDSSTSLPSYLASGMELLNMQV